MDVEDLPACFAIRQGEIKLSIKTPGPSERWIDGVWSVCRAYDYDLAYRRCAQYSIVQGHAGRDNAPRPSIPSIKAKSVDTIEAWICSCLLLLTGASPVRK